MINFHFKFLFLLQSHFVLLLKWSDYKLQADCAVSTCNSQRRNGAKSSGAFGVIMIWKARTGNPPITR